MDTTIPGDGKTFAHHLIVGNFNEIFHHDIPIVLGLVDHEAKVLRDGWNKLEPQIQTAMVHGSGIIDEIANDLDKAPATVIDNILSKFTNVKVEDLKPWLAKVQGVFTGIEAIPDQDLATTIENLQEYFKKYVGPKFGDVLSTAAQILTSFIAPDLLFSKIATYITIAYRIFVRK